MKANDIFNTVITLMFGTDKDRNEYEPYFLPTLNMILAENFVVNNALRVSHGKEALSSVPRAESLEDDILYEDIFCNVIIPYGCAGNIFTEDDRGIGNAYKNKYEYERTRALCCCYEEACDVYL